MPDASIKAFPVLKVRAIGEWHEAGTARRRRGGTARIGGVIHELDWTDVDLEPRPAPVPGLR